MKTYKMSKQPLRLVNHKRGYLQTAQDICILVKTASPCIKPKILLQYQQCDSTISCDVAINYRIQTNIVNYVKQTSI